MSYYNAWKSGVLNKVKFVMQDFNTVKLNEFDTIYMSLTNPALVKIDESLLRKQGKKDTIVVSFRFPILSRKPIYKDGELYFYKL
jgi:hypothetical protein